MQRCRIPPQQIRLLPQVRGVRPRGFAYGQESKAQSRERSRNIPRNLSRGGSKAIRDFPLSNLYPEEVLGASPVAVAGVRPVVQFETVRPVLPVRPPVTRPAAGVPIVRTPARIIEQPRKHELLPEPKPKWSPPPTVQSISRPQWVPTWVPGVERPGGASWEAE